MGWFSNNENKDEKYEKCYCGMEWLKEDAHNHMTDTACDECKDKDDDFWNYK